MKKAARVVLGLGFGDEGKGLTTDYLCLNSHNPLVVRFNGGHQAGHTVVTKEGHRHMFSNFGAGTFRGVPTYWSSYCTFSPAYFLEEYALLPVRPKLLLDKKAPVTTHYDVLFNRALEASRCENRHGSCGLGFGATIERHWAALPLFVEDLFRPEIFKKKMVSIRSYYRKKLEQQTKFCFDAFDHDSEDRDFFHDVNDLENLISEGAIQLTEEKQIFSSDQPWSTYIFEGAQGILLDVNFGFQPHVTKSNTTSKNALEILRRNLVESDMEPEIYYVTRAYLTRHGAGPFPQYDCPIELINTEEESNQLNEYQGSFKVGYLDIDLLNYALKCDQEFSPGLKKHLIVTCLDQLPDSDLFVYKNGIRSQIKPSELPGLLDCDFVSYKFSYNSCAEFLNSEKG
jgi:adenylosuccinate synthase